MILISGLVLFGLLAFFVIRAKLRRLVKEIGGLAEGETWVTSPARIHLRSLEQDPWKEDATIEDARGVLLQANFESAGCFSIAEMPGLLLQGFVQPSAGMAAAIYKHPQLGQWSDIVFTAADDSTVTVTSAPRGQEIDSRPNHTKHYLHGATCAALLQRCQELTHGTTSKSVAAADFVDFFEKTYAATMDWRNSRGGSTAEEIKNVAALKGQDVDERSLMAALATERNKAIAGLETSLQEAYLQDVQPSASAWELQREWIVFVHQVLERPHVVELFERFGLEPHMEEDSNEATNDASFSAREFFHQLNQRLPERRRFQKVATVSRPVEADAYVASLQGDEGSGEYGTE